jgi:hypothetical protein
MRLRFALAGLFLTGWSYGQPPEITRLRAMEPAVQEKVSRRHLDDARPGWYYLLLYDVRKDDPQAEQWLERAEPECGEFRVLRRRLERSLDLGFVSTQPLVERLDQLLPAQAAGWERAEYYRVRSRVCTRNSDRQGARLNLEAAAEEPGLEAGQRAENLIRLAEFRLKDEGPGAFEETWKQAMAVCPTRPSEALVLQMLEAQQAYEQRRGLPDLFTSPARVQDLLARGHGDLASQARVQLRLADRARTEGNRQALERHWNEARRLLRRLPNGVARLRMIASQFSLAPDAESARAVHQDFSKVLVSLRLPISQRDHWRLLELRHQIGTRYPQDDLLAECRKLVAEAQHRQDFELEIETQMWWTHLLGNPFQEISRTRMEEGSQHLERALELRLLHPIRGFRSFGVDLPTLVWRLSERYESNQEYRRAAELIWGHLEEIRGEGRRLTATLLMAAIRQAQSGGAEDLANRALAEFEAVLPGLPADQAANLQYRLLSLSPESVKGRRLAWLSRLRQFYQGRLAEKNLDLVSRTQLYSDQAGVLSLLGDLAGQRALLEEAISQVGTYKSFAVSQLHYAYLKALSDDHDLPALLREAEAMVADPDQLDDVAKAAYQLAAVELSRANRDKEALDWIDRGRQAAVGRRITQTGLHIQILSKLGRLSEALEESRVEAASLPPARQIENLMSQSTLLERLHQDPGSVLGRAYQLCLEHKPSTWAIGRWVVYLLRQNGDWREAADNGLKRARAAASPQDQSDLIVQIALALLNQGRSDQAREWWLQNPPPGPPHSWYQEAFNQVQTQLGLENPPTVGEAPESTGALLDRLRLSRPDLGNLLTLRSTNIERLQAHLEPGQWLVAYYPVGEELWLVGLSRDRTFHENISITTARLSSLCREVQAFAKAGGDPESLTRLRRLLIEPVTRRVPGDSRLLLVPTGDLWKVPFCSLDSKVPVALLCSGDLLQLADGQWQPLPEGRRLAFGAPPEANLPGAERELEQVARLIPECSLKKGAEAEITQLTQGEPLALLHLATHAHYNRNSPMESYLQLHGGQLNLAQLHQLRFKPGALVVLSCCEGGLGNDVQGSEPVSLATALSAAGAQTLIANLWQVDDQAAELFFDRFYRSLQLRRGVQISFMEAQQATRQAFPDPFYWAGFCLLGNPR